MAGEQEVVELKDCRISRNNFKRKQMKKGTVKTDKISFVQYELKQT